MSAAPASITVMTEAFATDLVVRDGRVHGVLARHADGGWIFHRASHVVLATGGVGSVFLHTTNPAENTGDGLAMAARAGAALGIWSSSSSTRRRWRPMMVPADRCRC